MSHQDYRKCFSKMDRSCATDINLDWCRPHEICHRHQSGLGQTGSQVAQYQKMYRKECLNLDLDRPEVMLQNIRAR